MKVINKKDLTYKLGILVNSENEQVGICPAVALQLEKLEVMIQQHHYLKSQPKYSPGPSLEGFEKESAFEHHLPVVNAPDTPVTDKRVKEALEFLQEVDDVNAYNDLNEAIERFTELFDWIHDDEFLEGNWYGKIDLKYLGNPLELSEADVVHVLGELNDIPVVFEED